MQLKLIYDRKNFNFIQQLPVNQLVFFLIFILKVITFKKFLRQEQPFLNIQDILHIFLLSEYISQN